MSTPGATVLVVDDEPHIRSFLDEHLASDDWTVHSAGNLAKARSCLNAFRPELVLLDVMLPDGSGFDLCREIRDADPVEVRFDPGTPVIMLTARGEDVDRVRGFQRGADDYIVKPFHYPELVARMEAVLRRSRAMRERDVIQVAGIEVDCTSREVFINGSRLEISAKEFDLLTQLARDPRRVWTKQELLESVWGFRSAGTTRTLDSHISRLRTKLRPLAGGRDYLANVWGVGYRLVSVEEPVA
jgi:DNA-binding response OmpR family regulator